MSQQQMMLAGAQVLQVALSPTLETGGGPNSSFTFGSVSATVSGAVGSLSYVWSVGDQVLGTFSILSGQGTSTAVARVTGVVLGDIATGNLVCLVTDTLTGVSALSDYCNLQYERTL